MRVVLVAHSFPPHPLVGSFRAAKIAGAFQEAGHEVDVITSRIEADEAGPRTVPDGVRVQTIRAWPHPIDLYQRLPMLLRKKRALSGRASARSGLGTSGLPVKESGKRGIRHSILALLRVPDRNQGFSMAATFPTLRACREGADLLYTTGPPHSSHITGYIVRQMTGVPWVAELRDPWDAGPSRLAGDVGLARRLNRRMEHRVLQAADRIVVVTEGARRLYCDLFPAMRRRIVLARNGVDRIEEPPRGGATGPIVLSHLGSLYGRRDPVPFLEALGAARRAGRLPERGVVVQFVGLISEDFEPRAIETMRRLEIESMVRMISYKSPEEVRDISLESDALLLIAPEQPIQIPNKLYEYIGTRRPILAIVDEQGESADVLRSTGGATLVYHNVAELIRGGLETLLAELATGDVPVPDVDALDTLRSQRIYPALIRSLDPDLLRRERGTDLSD